MGFGRGFSFAVDSSTCYKSRDKKLDSEYNFLTNSTHLNFENSLIFHSELKTLLASKNSKFVLNVINISYIFTYVEKKSLRVARTMTKCTHISSSL